MKRVFGIALLFFLSSVALMAAQNSQTFYLATGARAGSVQLPRGICEVRWSTPSGSRVKLTFKTEDEKTFEVPARVVEGKQGRTGVVTSIVDGVTYLQEFHTNSAKFIIQNKTDGAK